MPLTRFIKEKDVREKFIQQFPKPKFTLKAEILAHPSGRHPTLVGTAFDYVLRFYLKRINPEAITSTWIAEKALASFSLLPQKDVAINFDMTTGKVGWLDNRTHEPVPFTGVALKVSQIIDQAKLVYNDYLVSGQMTEDVLKHALLLAQIDPIYRNGYIDENLGKIDKEGINDLRALISLVKPETFKAKELCVLNPTFGKASGMVGGADADLIIDDMLVDIKTVKEIKLELDNFIQLMGYYALSKIGGIDHAPPSTAINRIGIYYSRHGELYSININDITNPATLEPFIDWFKTRAARRP